jgi:hypothetical protein
MAKPVVTQEAIIAMREELKVTQARITLIEKLLAEIEAKQGT